MLENLLSNLQGKAGVKTPHLRWLFLMPVMVVIIIMMGILIVIMYRQGDEDITRKMDGLKSSASAIYQDSMEHLTGMLGGILEALSRDQELRGALAQGDRLKLLKLSTPIFAKLQKEYEITHFYFISADRVVLLRVHNLDSYGDVIDRVTTTSAQQTKAPAHGVELGPMGTLTLRYVVPLYKDKARQDLIGFIELGVDTGHLLHDIEKSLNTQMFEFILKDSLKRDVWEHHIPVSEKKMGWDSFPDMVPGAETLQRITPALSTMMLNNDYPDTRTTVEVLQAQTVYRAVALLLQDMTGRMVGRIIMLVDVTREETAKRYTLYLGIMLGIVGSAILFGLFWRITGGVGQLIERHQRSLHHLAEHDGLTGLLNYRTFHSLLEDEIARSQRYGTSVSLLMLDVDHFKRVNDEYGHVAGDKVLVEVGKLIRRELRSIDMVCRYGGEEITVILPAIKKDDAVVIAERLRSAVEQHAFKIGKKQSISITISIGLATALEDATSVKELVLAADQAMYVAKKLGRNIVRRYQIQKIKNQKVQSGLSRS